MELVSKNVIGAGWCVLNQAIFLVIVSTLVIDPDDSILEFLSPERTDTSDPEYIGFLTMSLWLLVAAPMLVAVGPWVN